MNRKLIDPFKSIALPEVIEEYLDYGIAKCCEFNRRGTLLATGTEDGYIIIWDFETRGVAKVLTGHSIQQAPDAPRAAGLAATVTSLAWSRNGRHLLSGALDKRVILWDVLAGQQVCEVAVSSGATRVSLSPRKPYKAVASLISTPPIIIDLDKQEVTPLASMDFKASAEHKGQQELITNMATGVAVLSKSGREVLLGQLRGTITVYDTDSQQVMDVVKLPAAVKVMSLSLNRQGTLLLVNCSDKVVRLYEVRQRPADAKTYSSEQLKEVLGSVETGRVGSLLLGPDGGMLQLSGVTFQNAVEKNQWRGVVLSGDSEHVIGAVASKHDHRIYIWSRLYGKLEKILEGPRNESTSDLAWHPTRSQLVTLSGNGKVYIWAQIYNENWSAFAPDFQELDENQEYVEQEDEFDINEKPVAAKEGGEVDEEDVEVDILTREVFHVFSSDEEDDQLEGSEEPLHWLPAEVNLVESAAPGEAQEQQQAAAEEQQEESEESSDGEGEEAKPEDLILDRPRDRKRRVRFEDYGEESEEDDLPPMPSSGPPRGGGGAGRGRGRGRRGRPPKYAGVGAALGRGAPAGGGGYAATSAATGMGVPGFGGGSVAGHFPSGAGGFSGGMPAYGGSGGMLNPSMGQQQQLGPGSGSFGALGGFVNMMQGQQGMQQGGMPNMQQQHQQQQQWPGIG